MYNTQSEAQCTPGALGANDGPTQLWQTLHLQGRCGCVGAGALWKISILLFRFGWTLALNIKILSWAWWCTLVVPAERLRQAVCCRLKTTLGNKVIPRPD